MIEFIINIIIYILFVSLIGVALTLWDKHCAVNKKRRVPEKMLFAFAFLGGALPMLITMKIIRHKTRHKRFMLGLPAAILIQTFIILFLLWYLF